MKFALDYACLRDLQDTLNKQIFVSEGILEKMYLIQKKIKLIHISTDYVYCSDSVYPISEESNINPINYYGFSKREGEKHIENSKSESIVIRTSWLYSKYGNIPFFCLLLFSFMIIYYFNNRINK